MSHHQAVARRRHRVRPHAARSARLARRADALAATSPASLRRRVRSACHAARPRPTRTRRRVHLRARSVPVVTPQAANSVARITTHRPRPLPERNRSTRTRDLPLTETRVWISYPFWRARAFGAMSQSMPANEPLLSLLRCEAVTAASILVVSLLFVAAAVSRVWGEGFPLFG